MSELSGVMKLKDVLRALLKTHDLNVAQLARATKLSDKTIHNWLAGQTPRNLDQLRKVAEHFNTSMDAICGYQSIQPKEKNPLEQYIEDEIYAGKFEVILRRLGK